MGWMGDIAVLGAIAIGGWWFMNNYQKLGIGGGGGGSTLPPLEGGGGGAGATLPGTDIPAVDAGGNPVDPRQDIRKQFETKYGLSSTKDCASSLGPGIERTRSICATVGGHTALINEYSSGRKCTSSTCGRTLPASWRRQHKIENCNCTYPAVAASAATTYIAHYATRIKPSRDFNSVGKVVEQ